MDDKQQTLEEYYQSLDTAERRNLLVVLGKISEPNPSEPKPEEATSQQTKKEIVIFTQGRRERRKQDVGMYCDVSSLEYVDVLEKIASAAVNYYRGGDIRDSRTLREALERVDWMEADEQY